MRVHLLASLRGSKMRNTLRFLLVAGVVFSHAALACEDGPECQDRVGSSASEVRPASLPAADTADAEYVASPGSGENSPGAEPGAPTAHM